MPVNYLEDDFVGYYSSGSDLVDIDLLYLEGGTAINEDEGRCLIMVDGEQYGNDGDSKKRRLLSGPEPVRYSLQPQLI